MPQFRPFITALAIVITFFTATELSAKADTLTFSNVVALQDNGLTRVNLLSNPGVTIIGPRISFLVDIQGTVPAGVSSLLRITYTEAGSAPIVQTFAIPAFGSVPPPYSQLFTINSPGANAQGVAATLTISIISGPGLSGAAGAGQFVTHTYSFNVAQPVPEPTSMVLLGSGVIGLWARARRRRARDSAHSPPASTE
ncbi:MAG: hypothetical protein JWM21_2409 [Acidobacteria bacterium]|nr:hypothetical protein [Acidobacteriota bacterium]